MDIRVVDTNVLVRYLARDDSEQWEIAAGIISGGDVLLLSTVLLETEWVLRKVLRLDKPTTLDLFGRLAQVSTVVIEEPKRFRSALAFCENGLDFADAFHLASVRLGGTFVTFDRALVRAAQKFQNSVSVELAH
ncbi:putative nucleic-acid-binding protein [Rhizobium sp. SG_E_25_P2]|uniref:type II toxin-antitoxin system VapC family toxin n=1 Tax=Rhizobium sp. SG_E_25_P2 TaxID=2879942 RepID=UPI002475AD79|nr:type II toxin-antitoxin system VapC family toxin [Rhizobium sp. SG_E_25_P2]MDH6267836.1 putative nucleic-acid-binding protein [Rhizobium sp. SG_E_25_P2]